MCLEIVFESKLKILNQVKIQTDTDQNLSKLHVSFDTLVLGYLILLALLSDQCHIDLYSNSCFMLALAMRYRDSDQRLLIVAILCSVFF